MGELFDPSLLLLASHLLTQDRQRTVLISGLVAVHTPPIYQLHTQLIPTSHNDVTLPATVLIEGFSRRVGVLFFPSCLIK